MKKNIIALILGCIIIFSCNDESAVGVYNIYKATNDGIIFNNVSGTISIEPYLGGEYLYIESHYPDRDSMSIWQFTIINGKAYWGNFGDEVNGEVSYHVHKNKISVIVAVKNWDYVTYEGKK